MQKRELATANEYFPGKSQAMVQARNSYVAALQLMHQDEFTAFNAKFKTDPSGPARLTHAMEHTKEALQKARAGKLGEKARENLLKKHNDLMKELGGRKRGWDKKPIEVDFDPEGDDYDDYEESIRDVPEAPHVVHAFGDFGELRKTDDNKPELHLSVKAMHMLEQAHVPLKNIGDYGIEHTPSGLSLGKDFLDLFISRLVTEPERGKRADRFKLVALLANAQEKNMDLSQGVSVVLSIHPKRGDILAEEWGHGFQRFLAHRIDPKFDIDKHISDAGYKRLAKTISEKALPLQRFLMKYYKDASPRVKLLEGAIKVMTRDPVRFGLNKEQALDVIIEYLDIIEKEHGADVFKELSSAFGHAKEAIETFYGTGKK
jgi:hypothetical protein